MAINVNNWLVDEPGSAVLQRVKQVSAIEDFSTRVPMRHDTMAVPRSGGTDVEVVAKAATYGLDATSNDKVVLDTVKFGKAISVADEDVMDVSIDIFESKRLDWFTSYAKFLDNACLGVTAAANGTTVPFTSVYKALTTTNAATGYTANANRITSSVGRVVTYDQLSSVLSLLETSDYFDDSDAVVMAHPYFKGVLRGIKDTAGNPIFLQGLAGTPDSLFGYPVHWTRGARTSATAAYAQAALGTTVGTAGNPLLIVGSRQNLLLGVRSGPEYYVSAPRTGGPGQMTDEWIMTVRSRRAFAVGNENAFAMLEVINA